MSITSYNFKNHITIDNTKFIKWLDNTGTIRNSVLGVSGNNLYINSITNGNIYINKDGFSRTVINLNATTPVIVGTKLGIGVSESSDILPNITLTDNAFIGLNTTTGTISFCGSNTLSNSAKISIYGNGIPDDNLKGNVSIYAGDFNNINAGINFYTASNSRKMKIYRDGTIELTPDGTNVKYQFNNNSVIYQNYLSIQNTTNVDNSTTGALIVKGGTSLNNVCIYSTTQATGFGTGGALTVNGGASIAKDIYIGGTISSRSDIRIKENIEPLKNIDDKMLDFIKNITTIKFNYKDDPDKIRHLGFIAQEFERYPEILRQDNNDIYSLDYSKITVLLIECIKELHDKIQQLVN